MDRSELLRGAIEGVAAGRGGLVFVTGEPGIGKTTAARAAVDAARALGIDVLWSACWPDDAGGAVGHGPWRSLLTDLGEAGATALAALTNTEHLDPTAAAAARVGLYARVVDTFTALARQRPLVVVLDDLHWADEGTVRLLATLRGRLPSSPLLVIGTYRDNEVSAGSPLASLATAADRIELAPLRAPEVAELIAGATGAPAGDDVVVDVLRRTGGNPFLVVQVGRLLATGDDAHLPSGARDLLRRRLDDLPSSVRGVLDAAAVIGTPFRPSTAAAIVGVSDDQALNALDDAVAARVIRRGELPGEFEFVHDLFREATLDALAVSARTRLHAATAAVLIEAGADAALVAHHLLSAATGPDQDAAAWSLRAADAALDTFAWEEAGAHAERALSVLPSGADADLLRADAWLLLGRARLLAGDRDHAVAAFTTAAALGRSFGSADLVARAALGFAADLGGFEVHLFDQRQIDLLEEAAALLASGGEPALRARILARLSVALSLTASTERRLALAEQAVALARSGSDPIALAGALAAHCDAISGPDDIERRCAEAEEVIDLAAAAGDGGLELLGRRLRYLALLEQGNVQGAASEAASFARRAVEVGNPLYTWYVSLWRGLVALADGDIATAEEMAADVERIGARAGSENAPMLSVVLQAELAYQANRVDLLRVLVDRVREVMGELYDSPQSFGNLCRFLHELGRDAECRSLLDRLHASGIELIPMDAEWLPAVTTVVDAAIMFDHPVLEPALETLRPHAHRFAIEGIGGASHGSIARLVANGLLHLGRRDEAVAYARQAVDANLGAGSLLLAHSYRTLADALGDDDGEGRRAAETANEMFTALGLAHRVRGAVSSAGAPVDEASLRRDGDVWHVQFGGITTIVKHVKGMADLAMLLSRPGVDVHVTELEALPAEVAAAARASGRDEALDRQAVAAYRARLIELDDEIADADDANDLVRAERARTERDFLLEELSSSLGLGGRARATGPDPVERLRKAVTSRVRDAIRRVEPTNPALARHLTNSIRTGTYCSYRPEQPLVWQCEARTGVTEA